MSSRFCGPFLADAFPEMMKSLDNNTGGSYPYCSNLTIEIQYEQNPLIHWFAYPGNDRVNALAMNNPINFAMDDGGTNVPDLALMWAAQRQASGVLLPVANRWGNTTNITVAASA